ncbi:MAG: hypothetical protein AAGA62_00080, partial [Bacteroidota bacterium]
MKSFTRILFSVILVLAAFSLLAQPVNDMCSGAISLPSFGQQLNCPADDGVVLTTGISGDNIDATPQTPFPLFQNCGTDVSPDVFYTFTAAGATNTITVRTSDMNGLQLVAYAGPDCDNIQSRACVTGRNSISTIIVVQPGEQVFFWVAGDPGDATDVGTFDIEVESVNLCDACARSDNGEVVINPRNQSSTYACGSTVEVCFTLFEFQGNDAGSIEYIHSVVPSFGSGWDVSTIVPTSLPGSCDGAGSWGWYPNGWTGCNTGDFFPRGFAYESRDGYDASCGPNNSSPGNNWGDGGPGCTTIPGPLTWCWNIDVLACPPGSSTFTGDDLTVDVTIYSDGYSGSWFNQACAAASYTTIANVVVCVDEDPIAVPTAETCPGLDDGFFDIQGNGGLTPGETYNFTVRDASSTAVYICNGCPSPITTDLLPPGDYTIEAIGVLSGCPRNTTATIDAATAPDASATHSDVCRGDGPIQLFGQTTTPGTTITYGWTGPGGYTANTQNPFTADPAVEGTYTLIVTVDGCPSDPFDIDVEYLGFDPMLTAADDAVCFGEDIELMVTGGESTFIWYDPDGSIVGGNSPTLTVTADVGGVRNYSVEVVGTNCTILLDIDITVSPEILGQITMNPDGEVCVGEDIQFFALQADGSSFPSGWSFRWDNGPVSSDSYQITANAPGNETMTVEVTDPSGCSQLLAEPYIVHELPEVSIAPTDPTICESGSVDITAIPTGGAGPYDIEWGPFVPPITGPTLTIDASSPITSALYAEVIDNNGCRNLSPFADVTIVPTPSPVVFQDCDAPSVRILNFAWNDVGQTHFEVYQTIGGGPEEVVSTNYTDLTYSITTLSPNTSVTIRVVPVVVTNGVSCSGLAQSQTCTTPSCNNPQWIYDVIDPICVTTNGQPYDLFISTFEAGDIILNSTTLGLIDEPNGAFGTTTIFLPSLLPGQTSFTHEVMASFVQNDGNCPFDTTFQIPVVGAASAEITTAASELCANGTDVVFSLVNSFDPNSNYSISIDDPAGTTILREEPNNGQWEIRFTQFRDYQITLTTQSSTNASCGDAFTLPFRLLQPPARPTLTCGDQGLDSVSFTWTDVGADSYTVDQITIPAGGAVEQTATGFIVRNLNAGDAVTIAVTANVAGCASVVSDTITCLAQSCVPITPMITTPIDTFCLDASAMAITLTADVPGGGTIAWSGPGVTGDQFDPTAAGPGEHEITVVYSEGTCTYSASFELVVVSPPSATFSLSEPEVCEGGTSILTYTGGSTAGLSFAWQLPAGTMLLSGALDGPGPLTVQFDTPGNNQLSLTVTSQHCVPVMADATVSVVAPTPPVSLNCDNVGFDQVGFAWSHPTATGFSVVIDDQPAGATINQTNNSLLATGLLEGESVTITVIALNAGVCGDADPVTLTCTAQSCPAITVSVDPLGPFCFGDDVDLQFTATVTGSDGSGTLAWEQSNGDMDGDFNPVNIGVGSHEAYAIFTEAGCTFRDTVEVIINGLPSSAFTLPDGPICVGEEVGADAGALLVGASYAWDIPGGDAAVTNGPDDASRTISWSTPGRKFVRLTVTDANGCVGATVTDSLEVEAPIAAPVVICQSNDLTSVTFGWAAVPGATGYLLSNGTTLAPTELSFTVTGLVPNESTSLSVTTLSDGVCGNSLASPTISCSAGLCPNLALDASGLQAETCLLNGDETIDLSTVRVTGGNGDGATFLFSGPGVSGSTFDASAAGGSESGTAHTIFLSYQEQGTCSLDTSFVITVFERPAVFITDPEPACVGDAVRVLIGSTNLVINDDISVDWDGGVVQDDGNPNDNDYLVLWDTPGTKSIV